MKDEFGVESELIGGSKGIFDVKLDGELIFSKHAQDNRFPNEGEVVELIQSRVA